ncbi:MAG: hypothetical protein ACP5NQ_09425, partial [Vulcanisaeta sp.]
VIVFGCGENIIVEYGRRLPRARPSAVLVTASFGQSFDFLDYLNFVGLVERTYGVKPMFILPSSSSSFAENINYITRFDDFIRIRSVRKIGAPIHGIPVIPLYWFDNHREVYILYTIKFMGIFKDVAVAVPGDAVPVSTKNKQIIHCSKNPLQCIAYIREVIDALKQYKVLRYHIIHPTKKVEKLLDSEYARNNEIILSTQPKRNELTCGSPPFLRSTGPA